MVKATSKEEQDLIDRVPIGELVQHYKGKIMRVLGIARHTETRELLVVYQKQYKCEEFGDYAVVVRPIKMWLENVTVNGKSMPRFSVIEEPEHHHSGSCCGHHH